MKKREIRIKLPEEFVSLCEGGGTTPEVVLKSFIGDLCGFTSWRSDGFHSNGADGRQAATKYYDAVNPWRSENGA